MSKPIKGVNLGGWLVLEPWITPSLFSGTGTQDEFGYCDTAGKERMQALRRHHKQWIQREDFKWLAQQGIEAVRIPVGYWVFGDMQPYIGSISYLDNAFAWAEEYGLKVLVCLHGAPGSQNGEMHSGRQGETTWQSDKANIALTLKVIERLAGRYGQRSGLLGIELLNEPSQAIPRRMLTSYYRKAYKIIRRSCGPAAWVVFSDRFKPRRWQWFLHWPWRRQAYQDYHHYQIFTPQDKALDLDGHLQKAARLGRLLRWIGWHRRLIVGEWSAALDPASLRGIEASQLDQAYGRYLQVQLQAFQSCDAWFYWTYRTESAGPWSFRQMARHM